MEQLLLGCGFLCQSEEADHSRGARGSSRKVRTRMIIGMDSWRVGRVVAIGSSHLYFGCAKGARLCCAQWVLRCWLDSFYSKHNWIISASNSANCPIDLAAKSRQDSTLCNRRLKGSDQAAHSLHVILEFARRDSQGKRNDDQKSHRLFKPDGPLS